MMQFHPFAEVFPLLEGADLDALAADIKDHGLREPIWLYDGQVLDGRNRFLACCAAKVEPRYRAFDGTDAEALAFVVSANIQRRHLTVQQRAMAAARIAALGEGRPSKTASRDAVSQAVAAEKFDVSRESVQRARKVINTGSKELQTAVESGEVPLKKAASVADLPKSEQLKAATQKLEPPEPEPEEPILSDKWEPDADEDDWLAEKEREEQARIQNALEADDKLAAAIEQLKQQSGLLATITLSRDGFMRGKTEITKLLRAEQRKVAKLERENKKLKEEIESLRERIAIMEAA